METFDLEFKTRIKLRKLLMKMDICFSKEEAEDQVIVGDVYVNGYLESDPNAKILSGDVVKVEGVKIQVK